MNIIINFIINNSINIVSKNNTINKSNFWQVYFIFCRWLI